MSTASDGKDIEWAASHDLNLIVGVHSIASLEIVQVRKELGDELRLESRVIVNKQLHHPLRGETRVS
jgi:hypothetical protein